MGRTAIDPKAMQELAGGVWMIRGPWNVLVIRQPDWHGRTRVAIYPIRGHGDERMMMVYLPGLRLLYGSSNDINLQQAPEPRATFNAFEVLRRVDALKLPVEDYVAIHTAKIPWKVFGRAVLSQPAISSG